MKSGLRAWEVRKTEQEEQGWGSKAALVLVAEPRVCSRRPGPALGPPRQEGDYTAGREPMPGTGGNWDQGRSQVGTKKKRLVPGAWHTAFSKCLWK